MMWPLLRRGLLVGVLAGLVAGGFAFMIGEPHVQDAIDIEQSALASAQAHAGEPLISRADQRLGLFLASALYGACVGTLFAVVFALVRGRVAARDDWQLSVRLAAALFAAAILVPFLKYPANPPAVGDPATIAPRTWLYVTMVAGGLAALAAAARVMWSVADRPAWWRPLLGLVTFIALVSVLAVALPGTNEVPATFPASLLWEFRLSALGTQAVLWTVLGAGFGIASLRAVASRHA